ncbi:hypothetical protein KDX31_09300 [Amphritea atlantica]|uniref:Uncharacterized protein n=1 Tax=Amphritea atlantica TaxID=355243 RepID=A0ABY5H205_9GAMM|nr:hypothetical protein KDX31_09300 [Amphritea atlantica]
MLKDIYFFNSRGLSEELKSGTFSEVRALKHLIVTAVIGRFSFEFPVEIAFSESEISMWKSLASLLILIVSGVITYYGLWLAYQANEKGDGKDFFLRLASLSLPIGLKLFMYFLVAGVALGFTSTLLISGLGSVGAVITVVAMFVATLVFYSLFYLQLRNHIAIISGYEKV